MFLLIQIVILSFLAQLHIVSAQQTTVRNISLQGLDGPQQQFATATYNFTLVALNNTLPNANSTGAPLVLGQAGATGGAYLYVTSVSVRNSALLIMLLFALHITELVC